MLIWPVLLAVAQAQAGPTPIAEPYAYLHGGAFTGAPVPESPDPMVAYRWAQTSAADPLQVYTVRPQKATANPKASFDGLPTLTAEKTGLTVKAKGDVMLDFGMENAAWVEFDSPDCPGDVEMSISEYNVPWPGKTHTPVRHGDTYRLELNDELYEGVRFAWIRVRKCAKPWHITGIRAVCQVKPTNYEGSFACSDPVLTRSWYMSAYCVRLNYCKDYFGAILMNRGDRISWTGDAHTAQAAALAAFGDYDFILKNIENTAGDDNGIRSYALYWVLSLLDYYRYTGDAAILRKYVDAASAKLDAAYADFGKNPGLGFYGWDERLAAGFEVNAYPCPEAQTSYQILAIRSWSEFAKAMADIGRTDLRDLYQGYADAKSREFTDFTGFGLHDAAEAADAELFDKLNKDSLYRAFGDRQNRLSYSPFNQYFVLRGLAKLGKYEEALVSVRDMWGGMLAYGGTTPFEDYRPSWNALSGRNGPVPNNQCGQTSLCHPWGAGVVKWLNEEILGIKPTAPGFTAYSVQPHFGRSLSWVKGATPTPRGPIRFELNQANGKGKLVAPPGTVGRLDLPGSGGKRISVKVNGRLVWDGGFHPVTGISNAVADADALSLSGIQPGTYEIDTTYRAHPQKGNDEPFRYETALPTLDAKTGGDWGGKYGLDGYVLCGYRKDGDVRVLPSYVAAIDFFQPERCLWAATTTERRALAADSSNGPQRAASCNYHGDNTFSLTIRLKERRRFRVAFYFVDWDRKGRETAVEMFDADTLKLLAPVAAVKSYEGGKYLIYDCDRSVKFRFDKLQGDNATLSGIFFDKSQP